MLYHCMPCQALPCPNHLQICLSLCRLHLGPDSTILYAQIGRMYNSAEQSKRAAHHYKFHIMASLVVGSCLTMMRTTLICHHRYMDCVENTFIDAF